MRNLSLVSIVILSIGILISSCNEKTGDLSITTITGQLENAAGETLFIQKLNGDIKMDSAIVGSDGSFSLVMDNPVMDFYRFFTKDMKEPVLLALDSTQRDIKIIGELSQLIASYKVKG